MIEFCQDFVLHKLVYNGERIEWANDLPTHTTSPSLDFQGLMMCNKYMRVNVATTMDIGNGFTHRELGTGRNYKGEKTT